MTRRLTTLLALLALTGGLAACGTKHDVVTKGETEGTSSSHLNYAREGRSDDLPP